MPNKWIILHNAPGPEPGYWGDDDRPVVFDSEKEAALEMFGDFICLLQNQLDELKSDFREPDEMVGELDEWVEEVTVSDEGVITRLDGTEIYDPKTFVR